MHANYHDSGKRSYYHYARYDDARKVADLLVKTFRDDPKFSKLLEKNKLLKAWVTSLDEKTEKDKKEREAKIELEKQKEKILSKLSEEEKIAFGLATNRNGKKIKKAD